MASEQQARDAKNRHSAELLRMPGVCGVGVQKTDGGDFYIAVHLDSDDPKLAAQLPKDLDGVTVQTLASGPFKKLGRGSS